MTSASVLVIGGAGKTGRRVSERLRARGIPTRDVSRSTTPAFDWTEPKTWAAALDGVSKAYVTYQPDLAVDGASDAIARLSGLARDKGLEHIVLLSGRGEPGAQRAEAALQASGVPWTVVRASWFAQNFSEGYLLDGLLAGELALPAGPVPEPFIDVDDIADVAVAALTENRLTARDGGNAGNAWSNWQHRNRLYEVTGARALTFEQAVQEISTAVGRPIRYTQVTPEAFAEAMRPYVPKDIIDLLLELFTVVLDGRNVNVMNGVQEALGRPARDFSDYVRATAATGVWNIAWSSN